jgi:hypothetical protein
MLVNFMDISVYYSAIWYTFCTFGIFCGHFRIFSRVGMLYQEKLGNPGGKCPKLFLLSLLHKHIEYKKQTQIEKAS